ncbi:cell surface protein SprA [Zhouia spongiae]
MTNLLKRIFIGLMLCISGFAEAQSPAVQQQDTAKTGESLGGIKLKNPASVISKYTYDPVTNRYFYTEKIGNFDTAYPLILTPEQFKEMMLREQMKNYFKEKERAISGRTEEGKEARKNLLPNFYVNSDFFQSVFGGNTIEVIPTGSIAVDLGLRIQKNDNPALSPRNRTNITFDFDQRISLSLLGKVGERLTVNANYDTEATLDFQNQIKLEYTPSEDEIIRKIEVGNISLPLNSSLINGAQSLFGVKTELQFGRTKVTAVFSEQRSQNRRVVAEGGATINEFDISALDYDADRHFFLSHFFRDQYDQALENYPYINSAVQLTRVEVWVTNRIQNTQNVRNIVALQDLGEPLPDNTRINQNAPAGFFNSTVNLPRNEANDYDPFEIGGSSVLTEQIRDVATVQQGFGTLNTQVNQGYDYAVLENARKLEEGRDYRLEKQLGYISLNQRLSNDEILAVAYQYTYRGEVYQVGEFANDGVNATEYESNASGQVIAVNPQSLVLKMLKSNLTRVEDPVWDLMMKNIYATGAFQLLQEDFKMNILYTNPSPVNYISPVDEGTWPGGLEERILLDVFNFDRLNVYNDPQNGGDGFFDYYPGITVDPQNGLIIFTKAEPFGEHIHGVLGGGDYNNPDSYNANQAKYVFRSLYASTQAAALEDSDKNKYQLKGKYRAEGGRGISLGTFNVPRGSVRVKAGGRILQEGVDYTVNYIAGTVQILDEGLKASNIPIEVSVENNAVFGQQTRRFAGINVEHKVNDNFMLGGTFLNLSERPLTQKANYGTEPVNNTIFGFNGNYSTELPFLTRWVNKLPNIDTDVASNISVRGEFAYLLPGSPKMTDFDGETTVYLDDFEGAQAFIDVRSPLGWSLASAPVGYGGEILNDDLASGEKRAKLAWYTIDPVFYTSQRPSALSDNDISLNATRRVYIDEIFPQQDVAQGQTLVQTTLDLAYYPGQKGPYNNNPDFSAELPQDKWGGIMRSISSTNFEQANVEYIQFWVLDPYYQDGQLSGPAGELVFNLGSISEDILKDGRKQYENGLPGVNSNVLTNETAWGKVPASQSLVYAFDAEEANRQLQDVGFDGLPDSEEAAKYTNNGGTDPALDNYEYYLNVEGSIMDRYLNYNNPQGNSPVQVTNTNRGSTTLPDVEDVNRDLTMNTVDSYYEYRIPIAPGIQSTDKYVSDVRVVNTTTLPNNDSYSVRWIQYKIPVRDFEDAIGGITDFRSISYMRMYMTGFTENTVLRFGTLDLVRGDWRTYTRALNPDQGLDDQVYSEISTVNIQENDQRVPVAYVLPPGVRREQLNTNNTVINVNEQSLSFKVCDLGSRDAQGVYKNVNIDLRQYKKLKMFVHAEEIEGQESLDQDDLVAFIRFGTDYDQNYYQVEVPLKPTDYVPGQVNHLSSELVWPAENNIDVLLSVFSKIKAEVLQNTSLSSSDVNFFNEDLQPVDEYGLDGLAGDKRYKYGIKGNPSLGNVRSVMIGLKNGTENKDVCGEVWFDELRLAGLDNNGGWAAVASVDGNVADFASYSVTGSINNIGFGALDQTPNERSREKAVKYGVNTNVNLGQLLPKKWGVQIPLNYNISEELITPEFDPLYQDLKLQDRLDAADNADRERIKNQSEDYTKRKGINFIGVRKDRGEEQKPHVYDIENFTFNVAYNETTHRDFEVEQLRDQAVRAGFAYSYNFEPEAVEPFRKKDSLFTGKYWQWLKDLNFNYLPNNISVNSNINRSFNQQRFREVFEGDQSQFIGLPELQQRNFLFDWQYAINYNLTRSVRLNFTAANNNIVRNYYTEDEDGNRTINREMNLWSGFWDAGEANRHTQRLQLDYELPFDKIPTLSFINATYTYTSDFDWQRGGDVLRDIAGQQLNTVQNASTHVLNGSLSMDRFYRYLGLKSDPRRGSGRARVNMSPNSDQASTEKENKGLAALTGFATMLKRVNISYSKNAGKVLPGYIRSVGFIGTLKPSWGFVFGSQQDVRYEAARKGWLTTFPDFNQQFMERDATQLDVSANLEPFKDLTIDLVANRQYSENYTENFRVDALGGGVYEYVNLLGNQYGDFSISSLMIKTAFQKTGEATSETFNEFSKNRIIIAQRLAGQPVNPNATTYPDGYGPTNQSVLLPAFVAAYTGQDAGSVNLGAFRDTPIPNWSLKYTGLMRLGWFKDVFRRFSIGHGYRSSYSVNAFRTNLEYDAESPDERDQAGNFKNPTLYTNATLVEQFNPLVKVDFEMKNAFSVLAELRKERMLSLSFDNNLLTEMSGNEYILGLGYRIKDLRFVTNIGGKRTTLKSDLNIKADLSLRDNITIIRNLDINTNQVTAGQNIWGLKFTADYALTENLTALFYYDHTLSKYKVSTAYPQATIRSGITLRYNFGN